MNDRSKVRSTTLAARRFRKCGRLHRDSPRFADAIWRRLSSALPLELVAGRAPIGCNPNIRLYKYSKGDRFGRHVDGSNAIGARGLTTEATVLLYLNDSNNAPAPPQSSRVRRPQPCARRAAPNRTRHAEYAIERERERREWLLFSFLNDFARHTRTAGHAQAGGATIFYEPRARRPRNFSSAGARLRLTESERPAARRPGGGVIEFAPRLGACLFHLHGDRCLEHEGAVVTSGAAAAVSVAEEPKRDSPPHEREKANQTKNHHPSSLAKGTTRLETREDPGAKYVLRTDVIFEPPPPRHSRPPPRA